MKVLDYYSGFEGEPEIRLIQMNKDGENISVLKLWEAYFRTIIELIEPNEKGYWEGVTLQYHLATGWYDDDSWECDDIPLFLKQLESIDENKLEESDSESIERESHAVLKNLKSMLQENVDSGGKIIIEYD